MATIASAGRASGQKDGEENAQLAHAVHARRVDERLRNLEEELPQHQDRRGVEQVRNDERRVGVDPAELHDQRVERNQRQLAGHEQHRHRRGVERGPARER